MKIAEGATNLDRDGALRVAREQFEAPVWALIDQLEVTLSELAKVRHINISDSRAIGSVLNSALAEAASVSEFSKCGLEVNRVADGQSNKVTGSIDFEGTERTVSFELHLCGPRGGTAKSAHQFAGNDIEAQPTFPGFGIEAPASLLLFIALHLGGTGVSVARAFLKFADGIDQRMVEIHRIMPKVVSTETENAVIEEPTGAKLRIKTPMGEQLEDGSATYKRGNAAPGSQ